MATKSSLSSISGALWDCDDCGVWWASQVGKRTKTSILTNLPEPYDTQLSWDNYRGWKYPNTPPSKCPQCGKNIPEPMYSHA
jgi:rubrerythrin